MTADVPDVRPSRLAPSRLAPSRLAPSRLALPSYARPRGVHPPLDYPGYRSTALRHPKKPLVLLPQRLTEVTGPLLGDELITPTDGDLTMQHAGEPQGQRIILTGRVLDSGGRPVPDTLIEIWQTNAAGRYRHAREHHPAPRRGRGERRRPGAGLDPRTGPARRARRPA
jgi:protocatechuate 3,4-dioxygenase beta subunit